MAPLIVITGPTASGKTGLALDLAERYGGEIICADSRTVYAGMDIGTAKPSKEEQARVVHHGLDVVRPGERFTAQDFQRLAYRAIDDIRARGKVPFLVGGTGLYVDAVVRRYSWPSAGGDRTLLEGFTITELQELIKKQHMTLPVNNQNRRHLINTILRGGESGSALEKPAETTHVVAIATDLKTLEMRIQERARAMFSEGVLDEAKHLGDEYGWDSEAMSSNIYPILRRVLDGELSQDEAERLFVIRDRQLVKRQLTWLRRYDYITWLPLDEAGPYIETKLSQVC